MSEHGISQASPITVDSQATVWVSATELFYLFTGFTLERVNSSTPNATVTLTNSDKSNPIVLTIKNVNRGDTVVDDRDVSVMNSHPYVINTLKLDATLSMYLKKEGRILPMQPALALLQLTHCRFALSGHGCQLESLPTHLQPQAMTRTL